MKQYLLLVISCILLIHTIFPITAAAGEISNESTEITDDETEEYSHLWPKGPEVDADSAILMDISTGLILYEKNIHKVHYPASITKIMTTLLALENCSMGEIVTFSRDAIFGIERGSTHIGIDVGEKLTMEQCLYAVMLASANEVSSGVGEHVSGTISDFAQLMTKRAEELGCLNTNFSNANGLHNDEHYTSAYDMALIGQAAMKNPTFRKITATKKYTIPPTNKHTAENPFLNHHQMLYGWRYPQYEYEYCIGGKTGYTTKAGSTLVTFAERNGIQLVCVVMRAKGTSSAKNQYTDTTSLFNFAFENYTQYELSGTSILEKEDSPLFTLYSPFFSSEESPLQVEDNAYVLLPNTVHFDDTKESIQLYENLSLKDAETIIGEISYSYGGKTVGNTNILYSKKEFPTLTLAQPTKEIEKPEVLPPERMDLKPIIIGVISLVIIVCVWIYYYLNRPRRKNRKKYNLRF